MHAFPAYLEEEKWAHDLYALLILLSTTRGTGDVLGRAKSQNAVIAKRKSGRLSVVVELAAGWTKTVRRRVDRGGGRQDDASSNVDGRSCGCE